MQHTQSYLNDFDGEFVRSSQAPLAIKHGILNDWKDPAKDLVNDANAALYASEL